MRTIFHALHLDVDDSMPVHGLYTISYAGDNDCQGTFLH